MLSFVSYLHRKIVEAASSGCYVYRPVVNATQLYDWAADRHIGIACASKDLHVSVVYSKVDIRYRKGFKLDQSKIVINSNAYAGRLQFLGEKGAVVLKFQDTFLFARWRFFSSLGATWDYPTYVPHITLAYNTESLVAWETFLIQSPTFDIVLGGEIVEDLT